MTTTFDVRIATTIIAALIQTACSSSASLTPASHTLTSCTNESWVAGTTELCAGRLVYRDYLYDDYGADSGAPGGSPFSSGTLAATAGEARYPAGAEGTADLVRMALWVEGEELVAEFELNALYESDQTIAAIAVDTDDNLETGGGSWPGLNVASKGWDVFHSFALGDPVTNLIRGRFPKPKTARWNVWAVTAQADGTVMNVAFRGMDEKVEFLGAFGVGPSDAGAWWEDRQAAALAAQDITLFRASVDSRDLANGVTRGAAISPGLHQRVYTSAYVLPPGEGVSLNGVGSRINESNSSGSQQFNFLGKYQPYGYYQPSGPPPYGLMIKLHGLGATHASIINQPGFQQVLGENANRIIVTPLGRGVTGFYSDISERDVLDVMADAMQRLPIDPDAAVISGYSMGGYGAQRLAMLYPDRFAALINWVGPTGDDSNTPAPGNPTAVDAAGQADAGSFVGNAVDLVGNLRNLPSVHLYAGEDELLVHAGHYLTLRDRLAQAEGVVHDFYIHSPAEHLTFALLDDWGAEAAYTADRKRLRVPARVRYRTDSSFAYPEYALKHDRAYWLSDILARGPGYADVDIHSLGCGMDAPSFESGNDAGTGPGATSWARQYRRETARLPTNPENRLEAVARNVKKLVINVADACLRPGSRYRVDTDGPLVVTFSDGQSLSFSAGIHQGQRD